MNRTDKAEGLLTSLLWALEILLNPSPARILEPYESWYYRNFLRSELCRLERAQLLEWSGQRRARRCHLTPAGHAASTKCDPVQRWNRLWDGQWRMLVFDLPERHPRRTRLWRWLRQQRFGYFQQSAWIQPDPVDLSLIPLRLKESGVKRLTVMEGHPAPGFSQADIIAGSWDFAALNISYEAYLELAAEGVALAEDPHPDAQKIRRWVAREREAWNLAIFQDPLLPNVLLPEDYLGRVAWEKRKAVLQSLLTTSPFGC